MQGDCLAFQGEPWKLYQLCLNIKSDYMSSNLTIGEKSQSKTASKCSFRKIKIIEIKLKTMELQLVEVSICMYQPTDVTDLCNGTM